MTVINTNLNSLVAQTALNRNNRSLSSAMEQLSTGKRINSAADDAAGLAISSKMSAQIRGLDQAVRNANDGISLIQTIEGATVEVTNMMVRMRELAVQSANDTNTQDDRDALNLEFVQLREEVDRIGLNTEWNGFNLLNGKGGEFGDGRLLFQVGANQNQVIDIDVKDFTVGMKAKEASVQRLDWTPVLTNLDVNSVPVVTGATVTLGDYKFSVPLSFSGATAQSQLMNQLKAAINKIPSYENVTFKAANLDGSGSPTEIVIEDPSARAIKIELTKADATVHLSSSEHDAGESTGGDLAALVSQAINTRTGANRAIGVIDQGLAFINNERAVMGAKINRLTYAGDNLTNIATNTSASRSRIQDADYAKASSALARAQIIQQAATAVLAQANTSQQTVMKLLQ